MITHFTIIATVLLVADFVTSLAFCVVYHMVAKWWTHEIGKSIMIYQILMTIVVGLSAWRFLTFDGSTPPPMMFEIVRTVVFATIPFTLVWRTWVLIQIQRKEGRRDV